MTPINYRYAEEHLEELLERVAAGETFVLTEGSGEATVEVAVLKPYIQRNDDEEVPTDSVKN